MRARIFVSIAVLSFALAADTAAQSVAPDSAAATGPAKPTLFDRVVANQKRDEAALDVYERIERVEFRKHPNDAAPASVKISRVIPSGTGMDRIPVGPDGQPTDAAAYRADLEKLERALSLIVNNSGRNATPLRNSPRRRKNATI